MATNLKRIEKEFILGSARDDKVPFLLIAGSGEWPCYITEISADGLTFSHAMPIRLLHRSQIYEFRFIYREQPMAFRARMLEVKDSSVTSEMPEAVYKNLGRRYSRRSPPTEFEVYISFKGDRYQLSFPTTREFEPVPSRSRNSTPPSTLTIYAPSYAISMSEPRSSPPSGPSACSRTGVPRPWKSA